MPTKHSRKSYASRSATEQLRIRNIIRLGFAAVLGLTFCLGILGLYQLHNSKTSMTEIVELGNEKISLAIKMRDAIRLRALTIQRMLATDDYFRRDEALLQFYQYSGDYRAAKEELFRMEMTTAEKQIHETLSQLTRLAQPVNRQAAELLMTDPLPEEFNEVLEDAVITQRQLLQLLDQFVELQKNYGRARVAAAQDEFQSTIFLMVAVVALLLMVGSAIAKRVTHLVTSKNSELEAKNRELEAAWFEAANATHAKSKFLANMSHEIRTPLTSIIGFAETLAEPNQSHKDLQHAAESIKQSGKHLSQIINDVLDISKIEAGQVEMEMMHASPAIIVSEVANMMEEKIKKKGLKFRSNFFFPLPKTIMTDPTRLRQILLNLLSNAEKFTSEGIICINTYYLPEERMMKYEVSDTGIGMTPEGADKVFEPFSQAEKSTARKFGGTGLGLSISKQLAEKLGGDIVCNSKRGEGTTFTATISIGDIVDPELIYELDDINSQLASQVARPERRNYSGQVLLAEDTPENQKLISLHLHRSGVSVSVVDNGQEAVDVVMNHSFDLILMDMQMPLLNGVEATQKLRQAGYSTPIVMLTANTSQADRDICMEAGANDFLSKPIDFNQFFAVLQKYLATQDGKESLQARNVRETRQQVIAEDKELVELDQFFLQHLPEMIESIKNTAQQRNWQELEKLSHRLKGTAGSFGYHQLTAISKNIFDCARNHSNDPLDKFVAELDKEYQLIHHSNLSSRKAV
ncbi:response regulator [Kaarinaea lacus]